MPDAISTTSPLVYLHLEAKSQGLTATIEPLIRQLSEKGLWLSAEIRERILLLAGEAP